MFTTEKNDWAQAAEYVCTRDAAPHNSVDGPVRAVHATVACTNKGAMPVVEHDHMSGALTDEQSVLRFVQAGNATMTIRSRKSGERFTFKFSRPDAEPGKQRPIWVKLLSGPQNESDYTFIGTVWVGSPAWTLRLSAKSTVGESAPSVKVLRWFLKHLNVDMKSAFAQAEFWHEGRCGRCGRKLTVPESIASGFGPECAGRV